MKQFSRKKQAPTPRRRQGMPSDSATPRNSEQARDDRERRYSFRRNQTLTGSVSGNVSSAGGTSSAQLKSPRAQAHSLAQYRRNVGVILFASILSVAVLYILVSQLTATVIVGTKSPVSYNKQTYSSYIDTYLQSHPAERLRFLLNQERLNTYLQSVAPEVSSVDSIDGSGLGASLFTVTFRTPVAGWSVGGSNQYVDSAGVAFSFNYFDAPVVQIKDESGVRTATGQAVASDRFLGFVGRMVGAAGKQGYVVERIVITENTTRQVELSLKGVGYPVKASIDREVGEQVEDMARSIRWLDSRNQSPEYLDVRVSGRAFYK